MYSADTPDPLYLGFVYRDAASVLRAHVSDPSDPGGAAKAVSEKFCVAPNDTFDYTTKTTGGSGCQGGYKPLEFSLYMALDEGSYGRVSYTVSPDKYNRESAALTMPSGTARLIFGDEVRFDGTHWTLADGTALSDKLIAEKTGSPPLVPRQQYSITQAPVAAYVTQIRNVFSAFKPCTNNIGQHFTAVKFDIDSTGVITSAMSEPETFQWGAAIANLDLANPNLDRQDGGCFLFGLTCKNDAQCVRTEDNHAGTWMSMEVNTREQVDTVLNALRAIAPYYPDGEGEIHAGQ